MPEFTEHAPGTFCWAELMTLDREAAKKFYGELFGWTAKDSQAGETIYTMLSLNDRYAAALFERTADQAEMGVPPHWGVYVAVTDVDAAAARAEELGARIFLAPSDVFEAGRVAVIQDPSGALLSLWQAKQDIGAQVKEEPGSVCWNELTTHDPAAAEEFYTQLFGWQARTEEMDEGPYTMFLLGEQMVAGMMTIKAEWGDVPSNWMTYFLVADCAETAGKVTAQGGKTIVPATDIPGMGSFAIIEDPQGAVFGIYQPGGQG